MSSTNDNAQMQPRCRRLTAVCVALLASLLTHVAAGAEQIELIGEDPVAFNGQANFDSAGLSSANMLYPAPSAGGLLAGILTHGFLLESRKQAQIKSIQATADAVLTPYRSILETLKATVVAQAAMDRLKRWAEGGSQARRERAVDDVWRVSPKYALTQDQSALLLNAEIVKGSATATSVAPPMKVRVILAAPTGSDPKAHWLDHEGRNLRDAVASTLAHALVLAGEAGLGEASAPVAAQFRTIRYLEGSTERMERGSVLAATCNRQVIRNLRGGLMSVPTTGESAPDCTPARPGWP